MKCVSKLQSSPGVNSLKLVGVEESECYDALQRIGGELSSPTCIGTVRFHLSDMLLSTVRVLSKDGVISWTSVTLKVLNF